MTLPLVKVTGIVYYIKVDFQMLPNAAGKRLHLCTCAVSSLHWMSTLIYCRCPLIIIYHMNIFPGKWDSTFWGTGSCVREYYISVWCFYLKILDSIQRHVFIRKHVRQIRSSALDSNRRRILLSSAYVRWVWPPSPAKENYVLYLPLLESGI